MQFGLCHGKMSLVIHIVWITVVFTAFLSFSDGQPGARMQVSCSENAVYIGKQVGDVVSVYSDGYPNFETAITQPGCKISLEACLRCRFKVEIYAEFPPCPGGPLSTNKSDCGKQGCRALLIYDTVYRDTEAVRVLGGQESYPSIFYTTSNFITLDYCKYILAGNVKFNITIHTVEKVTGYISDDGMIVSPNFPYGYYARKEIYTYMLQSPSNKNHATLKFIDWELNQNADSKLQIQSFANGVSTFDKLFYAKDFRPMLFLNGGQVNLTFSAGSTQGSLISGDKYHGFKMEYEFTSATRVDLPKTDCGEYFSMSKGSGGEIKLYRNRLGDNMDCIWVIPRPPQFTNLMIKLESFTFSPFYMSPTMTIYGGMTSNGMPLLVEEPLSVIDTRHTTSDGLFIRLQGKVDWIDIKMVYLAYVRPDMGLCKPQRVLCADFGNVCISNALLSSGWDKRCGRTTVPTANHCGWLVCKDGKTCYSRCDGIAQCPDKSDEQNCPGDEPQETFNVQIVVPVIVLFLGVPIVVIPIFLIIKHCLKRRTNRRVRRRRNLLQRYAHNRDHEDHDNPAFHIGDDGVYRRHGTTSILDDHSSPTIRGIPPPSYHTIVSPLDEREQFLLRDRPPSYRAVLSHPSSYRLSVVETKPTNMEPPPAYDSVAHIQTQLYSTAQRESGADSDGAAGRQSPGAANPEDDQQNNGNTDPQPTLLQRLTLWTNMPWLRGSGADDDERNISEGQIQGPSVNPRELSHSMSTDTPQTQGNTPYTISRGFSLDSRPERQHNGARQAITNTLPERQNSQSRSNPGLGQSSSEGASNGDPHRHELNNYLKHLAVHGRQSSDPRGKQGYNNSVQAGASASGVPEASHIRSSSLDSTNSPGLVRSRRSPVPLPWLNRDSPRGSVHETTGRTSSNNHERGIEARSRAREQDTDRTAVVNAPKSYCPPRSVSYRTPSADEVLSIPALRAESEFSISNTPHRNSQDAGRGLSRYRNRPLHSSLSNLNSSVNLDIHPQRPHAGEVDRQNSPQHSSHIIPNRRRQGSLPSILHESSLSLSSSPHDSEPHGARSAAGVRPVQALRNAPTRHQLPNPNRARPPVAPKPVGLQRRSNNPASVGSQSEEMVTDRERNMVAAPLHETRESVVGSRSNLQGSRSNLQERPSVPEEEINATPLEFLGQGQGAENTESDVGPGATYV